MRTRDIIRRTTRHLQGGTLIWLLVLALCGGCNHGNLSEAAPCHGASAYCDRAYNEMVFAVTHNAMNAADEGWTAPNQTHGIAAQLEAGIRGLMLDVYEGTEEAVLCHSSCVLGKITLRDALEIIRKFLEENPREVISIIFESYASAASVLTAFEESGCLGLTYAHEPGQPWPTLGEMAETGQRLVVFTDHEGGSFPWYHDVWAHAWETHWSNETKEDFDCKMNRGAMENDLFILNHFLTAPIALESLAETVNSKNHILARAEACISETSRRPNFVTVDFYSIGDVLGAVEALNAQPLP